MWPLKMTIGPGPPGLYGHTRREYNELDLSNGPVPDVDPHAPQGYCLPTPHGSEFVVVVLRIFSQEKIEPSGPPT